MIHSSLNQYRALLARHQLLQQQQHKQLARRIHDDISQQLTLLSLQLSLALSEPNQPGDWEQNCKQWSSLVLELGQNLRNIINELQPRILDEFGLVAALQWYVHSSPKGVQCRLVLPAEPVALPPCAANELFAICRDIVSEVFAPNGITEATIEVAPTPETLRLHLRPGEKNPALAPLAFNALDGLSIHERLFCLDGCLETQTDPVKGVVITLSLPASRQPASRAA
jgi:signal transduction histidine kinase